MKTDSLPSPRPALAKRQPLPAKTETAAPLRQLRRQRWQRRATALRKQWWHLGLILVGLVVLAVGVKQYWQPTSTREFSATETALNQQSGTLEKGTPSYATLLPSGKTIEALGGWTRVSPPERNAVYAFTDTVEGTPVTVSQQPLPATFETDTEAQIEALASGYHAERFVTVGGRKVFIGDSAKGPQSIIYATDSLLILIKSSAPASDQAIASYIESLR